MANVVATLLLLAVVIRLSIAAKRPRSEGKMPQAYNVCTSRHVQDTAHYALQNLFVENILYSCKFIVKEV